MLTSNITNAGLSQPASYPSLQEIMQVFHQKIDACEGVAAYMYLIEAAAKDLAVVNGLVNFFSRSRNDVPSFDMFLKCLETHHPRSQLLETLLSRLSELSSNPPHIHKRYTPIFSTIFEEGMDLPTLLEGFKAELPKGNAYPWLIERVLQDEDLRQELVSHIAAANSSSLLQRSHLSFSLIILTAENEQDRRFHHLLSLFISQNLISTADFAKPIQYLSTQGEPYLVNVLQGLRKEFFDTNLLFLLPEFQSRLTDEKKAYLWLFEKIAQDETLEDQLIAHFTIAATPPSLSLHQLSFHLIVLTAEGRRHRALFPLLSRLISEGLISAVDFNNAIKKQGKTASTENIKKLKESFSKQEK